MAASSIAILYLTPIFDDIIEKVRPVLQRRFHFQKVTTSTLLEQTQSLQNPFIFLGTAETFPDLIQYDTMGQFYGILQVESEAEIEPEWLDFPCLSSYHNGPISVQKLTFELNKIYSQMLAKKEIKKLTNHVEMQRSRLHELNDIGASLSTERNLDKLLQKILRSSMEITSSDSGSLYLLENRPGIEENPNEPFANKCLRFKLANNVSLDIDFSEFTVDVNEKSIAGFVALSGKPLNIQNVYQIGDTYPFRFNQSFDQNTGYQSRSMLTVPMQNPQGEVIGLLQMINKNKDWLTPLALNDPTEFDKQILTYDLEDENLLSSLASQAAVAIENARLYEAIQNLFEGFIRASVKAIEARDPTTSGHSERVATLTCALAQKVDSANDGIYKEIRFTRQEIKEIQYASLLHDFGKIGVRENVLVKAEKLYPHELTQIKHRFQLIKKSMETQFLKKKVELLLKADHTKQDVLLKELDQDLTKAFQELDDDMSLILQANRPSILAEEASQKLVEIQQKLFWLDDEETSLLEPFELSRLSITKGSLDPDERKEIESHVTHTFHFLNQIPWTTELRNVPQIAHAHHEKLNGRGYPLGLKAEDIPIQSKMMTIADIYDALTASDRPYKKALPVSRALDILGYEVKDGMLDGQLYQLFLDTKVYESIS